VVNPEELRTRLQKERQRLNDQQELVDDIHRYYSRFGERVVMILGQYASRPNGLRDLSSKLQVPYASENHKVVHEGIARLITDKGVSWFFETLARTRPDSAAATAAPQQAPAPAPVISKEVPKIITIDRRSGHDRRSGIDRRDSVDLIYKNRRFGRDRRSGIDRRQKQLPPPWPNKEAKD